MPLVSVIIPAYNGVARYLEQAVDSVLAQTFQDFELIVVDDASTDGTARLILRFARARYCRRPENGGQAAARNDGARLAQGTYLAFLDQDDLWDPSFLEATLPLLQAKPEAALVHCDGYQVNERNDPLHYDAAMKHGATITQLLRGGHDVATSGSLFRRSSFDAVNGYDETLAVWEDIDLAIRLYQRFPILHLPKPLYRHRLYAGNASRDIPSERALQARRRFLEKYASASSSDAAEAEALRSDWALYYADLGKSNLAAGRAQEARQALWRSLRHRPFNGKTVLRLLRSYLVRGRLGQSLF